MEKLFQKPSNITWLKLECPTFFVKDNLKMLQSISWSLEELILHVDKGAPVEEVLRYLGRSECAKTLEGLKVCLFAIRIEWREQLASLQVLKDRFPRLRRVQVSYADIVDSMQGLLFEARS